MSEATANGTHVQQDDDDADVQVVRAFLEALEAMDIEAALDRCDDAVVYQNVPFPAAKGKKAVARQLRGLPKLFNGFEAQIHAIAGNGGTVLTERTDVLVVGRVRAAFWVCGTFEVRDGKVVLWRDYFDFADVTVAVVRGLLTAAWSSVKR